MAETETAQLVDEGRKQVEDFSDAMLLMDGRGKNAQGEDGAVQVNQTELFRIAERDEVPVLGIAAYHGRSEKEAEARPELVDDEDFQGLNAFLMLCVGARVLQLNFAEDGGGRREPVVAKQVMMDPSTQMVENVNFMPCGPNTKVKINVPVRAEGEDASPGVKKGGFAWKVSKFLEVRCLGKDIPPEIVINVASLDVGEKVFLRDLDLPETVSVKVKDENIPILKMAGKGK